MMRPRNAWRWIAGLAVLAVGCNVPPRTVIETGWRPEVQSLEYQDPAPLPPTPVPNLPPPLTVADQAPGREPWNLSLDEAIRLAIENARVVRVFTGLGASNSGRTIYDPAIATTGIDQAQARFDPDLSLENSFSKAENPQAGADPFGPGGVGLFGPRVETYRSSFGLNKLNTLGGRSGLNFVTTPTRFAPAVGFLNPSSPNALELSYTQPLLQGAGFHVNYAPIVLARLDVERSYFQFKDATQELVRGTIDAYWNLVLARIDLWAREIQYELAEQALQRAKASQKAGIDNLRAVSQARVTMNQFRANLVAARANVLAREGAIRNLLGLPASDERLIIPTSAPSDKRFRADWASLLRFAAARRPDIVELKLVLEADRQRRIQADNLALPRLDANANYRWNGLSGTVPTGERLASDFGQFGDWSVGVTFSVPIGLREGRARLREADLLILRDRANLDQGIHAMTHELAATVREVDSNFEQYIAFKETRAAALANLEVQIDQFRVGRAIYLDVLQALNDWGNAITSEARSLVSYNVLLATLERQTGTILETHGLVFVEERFRHIAPHRTGGNEREYPQSLHPAGEPHRYPGTKEPSENAFDLRKPALSREKGKDLPLPRPADPPKADVPVPGPKFAEEKRP